MSEHPLARIEARIAGLVEGAFSQVFGGPSGLQAVVASLSTALLEAMDQADRAEGAGHTARMLRVSMRPDEIESLQQAWPGIESSLARQVIEFKRGPRPASQLLPDIQFVSDSTLAPGVVVITAADSTAHDPTGRMARVLMPSARQPNDASLITDTGEVVALDGTVVSIGRAPQCTIVLDDPYASRLHAQIRLRGAHYVVFDAGSHAGTYVNEVPVHEHVLRNGDVIQMGRTRLIYQDQEPDDVQGTKPLAPRLD